VGDGVNRVPKRRSKNPIDRLGLAVLFGRGQKIFHKGQKAKHIYQVVSGCVQTHTKLGDGRRFVSAFYFAGDYFGLGMRTKQTFAAEASAPSIVRVIRKTDIALAALTNTAVAEQMLYLTGVELERTQNHSMLLRSPADERVGNFLFALKKRSRKKEQDIVMSRQEIADYLNLTTETVSRALTRLKKRSAISIHKHRRIAVRLRRPLAA